MTGRPKLERPAVHRLTTCVPADVWNAVHARAAAEGRTVSVCVREAVEAWLSKPKRKGP
jgi:hypothetical protein